MPLTRYQIRNEYGLADPELYKAADKDDPEALLEGVAMAGLVGVLRQLGDLAEFAAEIFHELHEEVISTAARGHGLMVRVQQLEAEVPLIEKAFLSQTSHTSFFTSAGVDWHPNLQFEQSLIARGDLPRFVMDSYEECRGPPRLFLLDKFDVAGAGACLKRYTDPSVFKVESMSSERSTIELQREKKIRKVKKKGPRWRNGGTPEIEPTSHAKLHELFLEERIDNCFNDPSRLVKLKKRQLNGCGIDSKNGKSYMEKFLETPSPEHKMVCETSVTAPTLHIMSDNTNELGLKILDITMVSPASKSPGRVSTCSSCIAQEEELKPPMSGDLSGQEIMKIPESTADDEIETTFNHVMMVENQLEYNGEGKTQSNVEGYHSDEVISEVDNYVDALATMESEIETDNEHRSKNINLLKVERQGSDSDANAEHLETQVQLSDSQSFGNSSGSEEGNGSFKRDRSSFSCSDTVNSSVDNIQYDSEGAAKASLSIPKACMVDMANMPYNPDDTPHSPESKGDELGVLDNTSDNEDKIPETKNAFGDSCFWDSITLKPLLDPGSGPSSSLLVEPKLDQTPSAKLVDFCKQKSNTEIDLDYYKVVFPDVPPKTVGDADYTNISERHPISNGEGGDINVISESLLRHSNVLRIAVENQAVEKVEDELLQREYRDVKTIDKQPLPEAESCSSFLLPSETLPASTIDSSGDKYNAIVFEGNDNIVASEIKYGGLPPAVDFETQHLKDHLANVADGVLQVEAGLSETEGSYSEGKANIVDIMTGDDGEITTYNHADAGLDELQLCFPNYTVDEIHVNSQESVTETVHPEGITVPNPAVSSHDELTSPGDLDHQDSGKYCDVATQKVQADAMVDIANCSDVATEKFQVDDMVDSANCRDVATEKVQVDCAKCSDVATEKVQADGLVASTAIDTKTATVTAVASKNLDHFSYEGHVSIGEHPTGTFQAEDGSACDADLTTVNDVNEVVCTSLDGPSLTSGDINNDLLENHPGIKDPYPNQNGFKDTSKYSAEPVIENKVNELEVASVPFDSEHKLVCRYSDLGMVDGIHNLPMPIQAQCTSVIDDVSIGIKSLDIRNLESDSNSSHQIDLNGGIEFFSVPPLCFSSAMETLKEPSPDLQAKHREMELKEADVDFYNSSSSQQSIKIQSRGQLDEEKVEPVQCPDLLHQDQHSNCNACEETIQAELSLADLPIQHPLGELNMIGQTMDTLQPTLPCFVLLPEVPQVNLNQMPPLPPLPPMQWRLGKVQQSFPATPRSEDPHPSILPSKDNEKPIGLEPSNAEILQPENPYSCFLTRGDDKSTHASGHVVHNMVQTPPISLQLPMTSHDNYQYSSAPIDDKQSTNPFLTVPPIPKENPENDSLTSDGEKEQAGPAIDDGTCKIDNASSYGHSIQTLSNSSVENMLQHVSQVFVGEQGNPHVMMAPLSLMKDEQSQHDLPTTEQEVASSSNTSFMLSTSEVGKPNGNPTSKLLRPRSPLIDAVAAHDKSKLRKVSDRILPQIGPKVDERDSLLAQIRTKSFNLKPAVVTRPSVQGPKTNLKVAAILEKANAIRQALAGSDEDADTDSWSDSE